jgi:hypothetical protein
VNKTEAAEVIALQVIVFARKYQQPFTLLNVQEHMSECINGYRGEYLARAAKLANHKTVYRLAVKSAQQTMDTHLVGDSYLA